MSDRQKALRLENKRQWMRSKSRQGAFEATFAPLDALPPEKSGSELSDGGKGAQATYDALDFSKPWREFREEWARTELKHAHPELCKVFDLVMENGTNREESIRRLARILGRRIAVARVCYWRHLKKILKFFQA